MPQRGSGKRRVKHQRRQRAETTRTRGGRRWSTKLLGLATSAAVVWLLSYVLITPRVQPIVPPPAATDTEGRSAAPSAVLLPSSPNALTPIDQLARRQDVKVDDWDSEQVSDAAVQQLERLQSWITGADPITPDGIASLVTDASSCDALQPDDLKEVYRHGKLSVWRRAADAENQNPGVGLKSFVDRLESLRDALGEGSDRYVKFKLFQIQPQGDDWRTRVRFEAQARTSSTSRQQTATWLCDWTIPSDDSLPRLKRVQLEDFEETRYDDAGGKLFVDCTASAMQANDAYRQQVVPGINYWLTRLSREFLGPFGHHGLAIGDVNGDHLDDLYVCDAGGLPNRLFVQQPDGSVIDRSAAAGVDLLEDSVGTLLIDLDNDGDQDLVVGTDPDVQLAENDGRGNFTWHEPLHVDTDSFSLSATDFDADGDLDLFVCGYNVRKQDPTRRGLPFPLPYHDANNGGRNLLLRNDGDFRFTDVTQAAGLEQNNSRFSMAAAWEDFDNDGDQDLYVANDFGRNNLYRNDDGRFVDVARAAGVEDHAAGMSTSWGDYDRDGRMDLYVGNMFSAAGNRVSYQRRFVEGLPTKTTSYLQRMARGNTLFANRSSENQVAFQDVSVPLAVNMGRWSWGSKFVDLTNDGWQDLVVVNGYVTGENADDL